MGPKTRKYVDKLGSLMRAATAEVRSTDLPIAENFNEVPRSKIFNFISLLILILIIFVLN